MLFCVSVKFSPSQTWQGQVRKTKAAGLNRAAEFAEGRGPQMTERLGQVCQNVSNTLALPPRSSALNGIERCRYASPTAKGKVLENAAKFRPQQREDYRQAPIHVSDQYLDFSKRQDRHCMFCPQECPINFSLIKWGFGLYSLCCHL